MASPVLAIAAMASLVGCGRVGFDPSASFADGEVANDPSLRVWLPFDSSDLLRDRVGGALVPCIGSCPTAAADTRGQISAFDGGACLELPSLVGFRGSELTVAVWVRTNTAKPMSLMGKAYNGASSSLNTFELWLDGTAAHAHATAGSFNSRTPATDYAPGRWYHLAGRWTLGKVELIVDGTTTKMTNVPAALAYSGDPVRVACDQDNGTIQQHVEGALDELRIYDRALSDAEIQSLAQP